MRQTDLMARATPAIDLEDLAQCAAGWTTLCASQQAAIAAELLELRVSALQSEHGICDALDCVLWADHGEWCHCDDLTLLERDGGAL